MSLRTNSEAPNFTAETTQGTIKFHDWIGDSWAVLFSHPKDFTPVCTTELGYMAGLKPEFDKHNTKITGLSVDPVGNHAKRAADIEETQGHAVTYPMIGDTELKVATAKTCCRSARGLPPTAAPLPTTHGAFGVCDRAGQENQGDADLSHEHRPELRRCASPAGFLLVDAEGYRGDFGKLAAGRDVIIPKVVSDE